MPIRSAKEEKVMQVFISHSSSDEDARLVPLITRVLEGAGVNVWTDNEILPGDNWAEHISKALQESDAMVALITPKALQSSSVRHEIEYALGSTNYSGRLIPVFVGDPELLEEGEVPWILRKMQGVHLSNLDDADAAANEIARALEIKVP